MKTRTRWGMMAVASQCLLMAALPGCTDSSHSESTTSSALGIVRKGTLILEQDAMVRDRPLGRIEGGAGRADVRVWLDGTASLANGDTEATLALGRDEDIILPEIHPGTPFRETLVHVEVAGAPSGQMSIVTLPAGWLSVVEEEILDESAVLERGNGFIVVDEEAAFGYDPRGTALMATESDTVETLGLCWCLFWGNVGKLTIDASSKGKVAMWLIPENGATPAFTPVQSSTTYDADGFKIGSQIYKIDGSTCNTMAWSGAWYVSSCVNVTAALLGKKPPYPVPNNTFGNEPPAGVAAKLVY